MPTSFPRMSATVFLGDGGPREEWHQNGSRAVLRHRRRCLRRRGSVGALHALGFASLGGGAMGVSSKHGDDGEAEMSNVQCIQNEALRESTSAEHRSGGRTGMRTSFVIGAMVPVTPAPPEPVSAFPQAEPSTFARILPPSRHPS